MNKNRQAIKDFDAAHPHIAEIIERQDNIRKYKSQTEMFWLLQLQFLSMSNVDLHNAFWWITSSTTYKKNKHTEKLSRIVQVTYNYTEEFRECLATHLALQLAQVEE